MSRAPATLNAVGSRSAGRDAAVVRTAILPAAVAIGLLLTGLVHAQPSVTASVDKPSVALDETLTLTVTVRGASQAVRPDLSRLTEFAVLSQGYSQSITASGGMSSMETTFQFTLRPLAEGTATIPSLEMRTGGQVLRTDPITVTVTEARAAGHRTPPGMSAPTLPAFPEADEAGGEDVFVRLETDREQAYVGEQIVLTFSVYYAARLRSLDYQPAGTEGFRTHPLPSPPDRYEIIDERRYAVKQEHKLLFPTAPGRHTITAASVQFTTTFWDPAPRTLTTEAIEIEVSRLPEAGKPASFSGVVGHLDIEAHMDQSRIKMGEAATLTTVVTGWGNLDSMEAPQVQLPAGLRQYQASEHREFAPKPFGDDYRIEGEALFDNVIIPTTVGEISIPPVAIAYFDPETERYATARSQPVVLQVEPGDGETLPAEVGPGQGVQLRPLPDRLVGERRSCLLSTPVVFSQLAALAWLAAALVIHRRRAVLAANPRLARAAAAPRQAGARIKAARRAEPHDAAAQMARAISAYLADKLDVPLATVSSGSVSGLLRDRGVPPEVANAAASVLAECDGLRFGFAESTDVSALAQRALVSVRGMERHLRRHLASAAGGGA